MFRDFFFRSSFGGYSSAEIMHIVSLFENYHFSIASISEEMMREHMLSSRVLILRQEWVNLVLQEYMEGGCWNNAAPSHFHAAIPDADQLFHKLYPRYSSLMDIGNPRASSHDAVN
jgi:hypothetical protein